MKNTSKPGKKVSAEQIARIAERGKDISDFFTNDGKMISRSTARTLISRHRYRKSRARAS